MNDKGVKKVRIFVNKKEPNSKNGVGNNKNQEKYLGIGSKSGFSFYQTQICYNDPSCEQIVWILISRTVNSAPFFR